MPAATKTKAAPSASDYAADSYEDEGFEQENEEEYAPRSGSIQKGWDAAKRLAAKTSSFAQEIKFDEGAVLLKFQDDEPIPFSQHFIEKLEGKKSHLCLQDNDEACPFCDAGFRRDVKSAFPVVQVTKGALTSQVLLAGPAMMKLIQPAHTGRYGPLKKGYWEIERQGKGMKTTYTMNAVHDLDNDGVDEAEFLAAFNKLAVVDIEDKILRYSSYKELEALLETL